MLTIHSNKFGNFNCYVLSEDLLSHSYNLYQRFPNKYGDAIVTMKKPSKQYEDVFCVLIE